MTGNGESRRKEDASVLVLFLIILFVKLSFSFADVPGFRNICVPEKCPARHGSSKREGNSVFSESFFVIKSGVPYKCNFVGGPIPKIKASPSRLNCGYEVDNHILEIK
jgi:hypothetical protein